MGVEYEGDYAYEASARAMHWFRAEAGDVQLGQLKLPRTAPFRIIWETYARSLQRIAAASAFPIDFAFIAAMFANCQPEPIGTIGIGPKAIIATGDRAMLETFGHKLRLNYLTLETGEWKVDVDRQWKISTAFLKEAASIDPHKKTNITPGIESMFLLKLLSAYASFEAFAIDLWVEAVNQKPELAENAIEKRDDRQITLGVLKGYGFDLNGKMGSLLKDTNKVQFLNLGNIKHAYNLTFKGGTKPIFDAHPKLDELEKTRHQIAHRGGLIDAKFKSTMSGAQDYPTLVEGEFLSFNGPQVSLLMEASMRTAVALMAFVDAQVTPPEEEPQDAP